ncbi:MmgE/PrpD family protein [Leisingera sp. ANG-M1]|uniref:MmgE/PrpD family protein n=1 Tax=Leisingera sp. ANG-M1 TaxID=1577895 RepID=UPI00068C0DAE|nr:MmgE/PrpD family protein [Leisingera sp. ANG-M1]
MTSLPAFARFAASAEPPEDQLPMVARAVADCFGCILAGTKSDVARAARVALLPVGAGPAPLYGTPQTATPAYAALLNAVSGHAYDLDDWEEPGNTHPTIVIFPALLAVAETVPLTGARMFAAYAVGFEMICRLGEAVTLDHYTRGFHSTATLGTIGAAAACARALGLTAEQIGNAMAIAVSQATGYTLQFGSSVKPLQAGFAARAAYEAALLARAGATAKPEVLDSVRGFNGLMGAGTPDTFATAAAKLGSPWALQEYGLLIKPWPSCSYIHRLMTIALELRQQAPHESIAEVRATMPDFHKAILPFDRPASRTEALFSVPACTAQVLVAGDLTMADSAAGFWERPEVARLIEATTVTTVTPLNPELNYDPAQPDRLELILRDGRIVSGTCDNPLGSRLTPMSDAQYAAKYHSITSRPADEFGTWLSWTKAPDVADHFRKALT